MLRPAHASPSPARLRSLAARLLLMGVVLAAHPARAAITPLINASTVISVSKAGSTVDSQFEIAPTGPPVDWSKVVVSQAFSGDGGTMALADESINVQLSPTAIIGGGAGLATGGGSQPYSNQGGTTMDVFFQVESCQNFTSNVDLIQANLAGHAGALLFSLERPRDPPYFLLAADWGANTALGRLPAGLYLLHAWCDYGPTTGIGTGPGFSVHVDFETCLAPLVVVPPVSQTVSPGSTTTFNVGTSGTMASAASSGGNLSFQWRRNLLNLVDDGRITGATSPQLLIHDTAVSDTGVYDVVVTQGTIVEPSSLARLTVTGGSVDAEPAASGLALRLEPPVPNPAAGETRVAFSLPRAAEAEVELLDVNGRLVKRLLPSRPLAAGRHAAEWNGRSETGAAAPPGVYLVRLRADSKQAVRRIVNLGLR